MRILPIAALTLCWAPAALAQGTAPTGPVPIEIKWVGTQPDSVALFTSDGGAEDLTLNAAAKAFKGTMARPAGIVEKRTILVRYGEESYPLLLNLKRVAPAVRFAVSIDMTPSCANTYVDSVEARTDNMPDAMRKMLTAARMLKLKPYNNCTSTRLQRTRNALFAGNYELGRYSEGLFALSDDAVAALTQRQMQLGATAAQASAMVNQYTAELNGVVAADLREYAFAAAPEEGLAVLTDLQSAAAEDPLIAKGIAAQKIPLASDVFALTRQVEAAGPR